MENAQAAQEAHLAAMERQQREEIAHLREQLQAIRSASAHEANYNSGPFDAAFWDDPWAADRTTFAGISDNPFGEPYNIWDNADIPPPQAGQLAGNPFEEDDFWDGGQGVPLPQSWMGQNPFDDAVIPSGVWRQAAAGMNRGSSQPSWSAPLSFRGRLGSRGSGGFGGFTSAFSASPYAM